MFFFFLDRPRPEMIDYLSRVVTNRDALNKHVRELQPPASGYDAEAPGEVEQPLEHESWNEEDLGAVLDNGLDMLSDERLAWLRYNPIALFELFDAINESLPPQWVALVLADAKRLWKSRPNGRRPRNNEASPASDDQQQADDPGVAEPASDYEGLEDADKFEQQSVTLARLVTNRDALVEHVRELQRESLPVDTDSWPEDELRQVLEEGIECLQKPRLKWLRQNPIALFELFDAINELLPSCWMDLVLADAKRLSDSRAGEDSDPTIV